MKKENTMPMSAQIDLMAVLEDQQRQLNALNAAVIELRKTVDTLTDLVCDQLTGAGDELEQ
jgi:hypothetical protein